jgi:hypothetical protein
MSLPCSIDLTGTVNIASETLLKCFHHLEIIRGGVHKKMCAFQGHPRTCVMGLTELFQCGVNDCQSWTPDKIAILV